MQTHQVQFVTLIEHQVLVINLLGNVLKLEGRIDNQILVVKGPVPLNNPSHHLWIHCNARDINLRNWMDWVCLQVFVFTIIECVYRERDWLITVFAHVELVYVFLSILLWLYHSRIFWCLVYTGQFLLCFFALWLEFAPVTNTSHRLGSTICCYIFLSLLPADQIDLFWTYYSCLKSGE